VQGLVHVDKKEARVNLTIEQVVYRDGKRKGFWWLVPELDYGWKADFIAFGPKKGIYEIEIKRSWQDYQNDFRKSRTLAGTGKFLKRQRSWHRETVTKYQWLLGSYPCRWRPTHFVYVAEGDLADRIANDPAKPKQFGVWKVVGRYLVGLKKPRRLCKITPEQMGKFRHDLFNRALWFMDTYYKLPKEAS